MRLIAQTVNILLTVCFSFLINFIYPLDFLCLLIYNICVDIFSFMSKCSFIYFYVFSVSELLLLIQYYSNSLVDIYKTLFVMRVEETFISPKQNFYILFDTAISLTSEKLCISLCESRSHFQMQLSSFCSSTSLLEHPLFLVVVFRHGQQQIRPISIEMGLSLFNFL